MSEHVGLLGKIERAGSNALVVALNRLAGPVLLPLIGVLVTVIGVLGTQVWSDIKDGIALGVMGNAELSKKIDMVTASMSAKIDAVAGDVQEIKVNQAVTDTKVEGIERRIEHIELRAPLPPSKSKGR